MDEHRDTDTDHHGVDRQAMERVVANLSARFPALARADLARYVQQASTRFERAPIQDFVPVLIEHEVRQRLTTDDAQVEVAGPDTDEHATDAAVKRM